MRTRNKLLAALLCAASPLTHAADAGEEVVVTATRLEQPLSQSLTSTTVITTQDIRDSQAPDLPTILKSVAGVEFSQNGGIGKTAGLFLRGAESTQVLVLLDGVRINSATTGTTALDQLMLDQVERIEVVRGNVSSLYGSEAIGGVVQIFTKNGRGAPAANVSAGLGSLGTRRLSAGLGGVVDGTDFNVQLSTFKTDGVSALNPVLSPKANPDSDGYRNNSVSATLGHAFNAEHRISATLFGSDGDNQYDSAFGQPTDVNSNRSRVSKLSLASDDQITEIWHSRLQLAKGIDQYRDYLNGLPVAGGSLYQTSSNQLSWQNALRFDDSKQLLLGVESLRQQVSTDINPGYVQNARNVNSLFAGYTGRYDAHQVQANVRQDRNSQYGNANTWLLGYGYALNEAWRATASYSTAFRAPTFNELYYPNFGDATLKPERSRNAEVGVHYATTEQRLDLVYFDNRTRDLIAYGPLPAPKFFGPANINQARVNGGELSYAAQFGDTGVQLALTSQDPRDERSGQRLLRRSQFHSSAGLTRQFGGWRLGAEWQHSGAREDSYTDPLTFATSRKTLPRYDVVNLTVAYTIDQELSLSLRADNLTDQNDSSAYSYNPLGRRMFAGISYQPKR